MLVKKNILLGFLFFAQCWAAQTIIPVVQDMYQTAVYGIGKSKILKVGEETDQISWLIFPKKFLPNDNAITQAYLGIYINSVGAAGDLEIKTFNASLTVQDPEINFKVSPNDISNENSVSKSLVSDDEGNFKLIDISDLIKSATFDSYIGLVLESGGSLQAYFDSREGARAPMLILRTEDNQITLPDWVENGKVEGDLEGTFPTLTIKPDAVVAGKIKDGAVTNGKLDNNSVNSSKIADKSVTTGKLADSVVTSIKLAPGAVNDIHIESLDVSKISNLDPTHNGQTLTPDSINTKNLTATNVFTDVLNITGIKLKMMVWETTIPGDPGGIGNVPLNGSSELLECPYPQGILFMTGTLYKEDTYIPMGTMGEYTGTSFPNRWEVKYVDKPLNENDVLTFYYSSALAGDSVRIVCFFTPDEN